MFKIIDRIAPYIFWICIAFTVISAGVFVGHFNWGPAKVYYSTIKFVDEVINPKPKKIKGTAKISDVKTETLSAEKAFAGYTLITKEDDAIVLLDMDGKAVHTWRLAFSKVWVPNEQEAGRLKSPPFFAFAQTFPNGDVMGIYHSKVSKQSSFYGAGLVKIDKESKVIWHYGANVHDAFYIAKNEKIYTLLQSVPRKMIEDLKYKKLPNMVDSIVILSSEGKEEKQIQILQSFIGTPYEDMLYVQGNNTRYTRVNSIMVLEKDFAEKFPLFKAGDILLSLGNIDTIAVINPENGKVRWAMQGMWKRQYDAKFVEDGTISLYDSQGYYDSTKITKPRVMHIDPLDHGVRWVFLDKDKASRAENKSAGMQQQLPNGNTLITEKESGQAIEVTADHEVVWKFDFPTRINSTQRVSYDFFNKDVWTGQSE